MATLAEHYARLEEEWNPKSSQVVKSNVFEKITHYSADSVSRTVIGDIFCEYVPQAGRFQPKATEKENEVEFAPVYQFFFQLFQQDSVKRLAEEMFGEKL